MDAGTETGPVAWTPHEQRWRECRGHMEREPGRLQLRVALRGDEGICNVLVEESDYSVSVLILVCGDAKPTGAYTDCPTHVYLNEPLGDRIVVDVAGSFRPVPYINVYEELGREIGLAGG